jgi:membrane associated rhomboid family serine protease
MTFDSNRPTPHGDSHQGDSPQREPAILAPTPLLVLIAFMIGVHAYRAFVLGMFENADISLLDATAFVPARFAIRLGLADMDSVQSAIMLGDASIRPLRLLLFRLFVEEGDLFFWTAVTYAFLHASWEHVIFNCLWLLAFGAPVIHRFGTWRFAGFFAATAAAAALFHMAFNVQDVSVLVGASGAVSGLTAAAIRFAIGGMGAGGMGAGGMGAGGMGGASTNLPAAPLHVALRDRRVLMFIGVWFAINMIGGLGAPFGGGGESLRIAWEAHIGGFLAGLILFRLFDPVSNSQ